jgi:PKD repeat protein
MKKTILALAISIAILAVTTIVVIAAPGDLLFQVFEPEPMVSCCGIGLDYDGTRILYTHYLDPTIHFADLSGTDLGDLPLINPDGSQFSGGLNAIAYNFNDGMLYGGGWSSTNLFKTDLSTGVTTLVKANAIPSFVNFIDGLAWDPRDNTFWMSDDVSCNVRHLDVNGNDIGGFDGCSVTGYPNSGLAVGLDGTLFYGTNGSGIIFALDTTTDPPTNRGQFASPGGRDEDMVCGPKYTKPDGTEVETLLSQDAYGNWFMAIEVAPGTCISPATNAPPTADPNGPYLGMMNTAIAFDGTGSSDPDGDALTYDWDWGDSSSSLNAGATPSHSYSAAGIYDVCLTVTDPGGLSDTACTIAVVYDPSAGFVTGGGWINSPEGAYTPDPLLTGKASFGFVSKYRRGATVPEGNTEFQFHAAGMNFHSENYEWLVVTGSSFAKFKGTGTINGGLDPNGNAYQFMVWAGNGSPDTFRIRIWWEDTDSTEYVIYDNGPDQAIDSGSIVIHTR